MLKHLLQRSVLSMLFLLTFTLSGYGQDLKVYRNNYAVSPGGTVAFPTAAATNSSLTFTLKNEGAAVLNLTGTPVVQISGTDAARFTAAQPALTVLNPGQATTVTITYAPTAAAISQATVSIASNDADPANYTFQVKGAGHSLYGPRSTPYGTVQTATNGEAGRAGGRDIMINAVSLGTQTDTYWGPSVNADGELQLKLSLDGNTYTDQEILTYEPAESNLAGGKAVWRGQTKIQNAINGTTQTVYIRATLTTKRLDNSIWPMQDPLALGLSEQAGGLIKFTSITDYLVANYFIEASSSPTTGFQPYLNYYDSYPTPPGPLPGQGVGAAYSTIGNGYYWKNLPPKLSANQIFILNEGEEKTITTTSLNASDSEDLPANPEKLVFEFTNPSAATPLNFANGVLKLDGIALTRSDKFTLKDIQDGKLSYAHNGSETVYDEFQFSFRDSKGALGVDGTYSVYTFKIQVTPVNDSPVTENVSFTASYAVTFNEQLQATDPDSENLTFEVVSGPSLGTLVLNPNGTFTYTPTAGSPGTDSFTYKAYDGNSYSNTSTVTLNLIDLPPTVNAQTLTTREGKAVSGQLTASDPEGTATTVEVVQNPLAGTLNLSTSGAVTYTPNPGKFGIDSFSYRAKDGNNNYSDAAVVQVFVWPNLDEGDLLIADKSRIWLYDPAGQQYAPIAEGNNLVKAQNLDYKKGTSIFVLDETSGLVKINYATGVQTVLAPASQFSTNPGPLGIALAKAGHLIIADGTNGIVKADTLSGALTPLFSGGNLMFTTGVLPLDNGDLIVTDAAAFAGGVSKIIRIKPDGTQFVITQGDNLAVPVDLALKDENTIIVTDGGKMVGGSDKLLLIDLTTGAQQVLSVDGQLAFPSGIGYHRSFDKLYAVNQINGKLLQVNTTTGAQTELSALSGILEQPWGLMVIAGEPIVTAVSVPANGIYKAADQLTFTVSFSEPVTVTGSPVLPLTIGTTSRSATYVSGSGSAQLVFSYTVQEGEEDTDGIQIGSVLTLNGGTIVSAFGNAANLTLNNIASTTGVLVDAVVPNAPLIASISDDTGLSTADGITLDQTLVINGSAEKASTVTILSSGIALGTTIADATTGNWVFDHTSVSLAEGTYSLTATATDAAGNTSDASNVFNLTIDTTAPVAPVLTAISTDSGISNSDQVTNDNTLVITGTAEAATQLTLSLNGSSIGTVATDTEGNWTVDHTGTALAAGTYTLTAVAKDVAGNVSAVSTTMSVTIDQTAPAVVVTANKTGITNSAFTATFTFTEEVFGFALGSITSTNATLTDLQTTDNIVYTALVSPVTDGTVELNVAAATVTDRAGNSNSASGTFSITFDQQRPTVTLATTAPELTNSAFTVNISFSEPVTGFELADITLVNGVASNLSGSGAAYTILVTPQADGLVSAMIAADVAFDAATNGNEASATLTRQYDQTAPTVVISSAVGSLTNAAFVVTVTFSEKVTGLEATDFSLTNASLSGLATSDDITWTATLTPGADGAVSIQLPAATAQDLAGNPNTVSNLLSTIFDGTAPAGYAVAFTAAKIDVTNAANTSLQVTGAEVGTTYYYTISSNNGGTAVSGSAVVTTGNFSIGSLNLTGLNDGTLTVSLYLQDAAGNKGAVVTAQVEKITRNITAVAQPALIKVPIRTAFTAVPLPATVTVTYATGETAAIGVVWSQGTYNGNVAGQYPLTGQLVLAPNTTNLDNKIATITVEVEPNKAPVNLTLSTSTFKPDTKPDDVIGTFATSDPDDTEHIYALVTGQGDSHNSLFELRNGNELHLKSDKGLSGKTEFTIRVRSTDPYQNQIEKVFKLTKSAYNPAQKIKLVNAFSPNADGVNDTWTVPELRYYNSIEIEVFDRSGIRLFHTTNPEQGWDGKNQHGQVVQGAYVYVIQVKDIDLVQKGVVTVIKK